jgi:exodeoxyribonuclease V alpha subunit
MNDPSPQPRTPAEEIAGLMERVTFFNEESGFAILRVKVRGQRDLVTALGSLPAISAGEWLTAKGWWVRDKEHGLQFKAQVLKAVPPTTSEGVERYLAGGFVKGVGPVLAKKLFGHFGAEVLGVIENNPADLESVDGIGPKRRERIVSAWQEGMQIREIMVFLHSHGVSTGRAVRIYKTYGNLAIQTVRENPYTLAKEIHGIGFATADQIAQSVGIPKDSQNRARAGIDHVLLGATSEGHCALPLEKLKAAAVKLLEVPVETIEQALSQMLTNGFLLLEEIDGEPLVFLPHLRKAEDGIATKIGRLVTGSVTYPKIDFEKAVANLGVKGHPIGQYGLYGFFDAGNVSLTPSRLTTQGLRTAVGIGVSIAVQNKIVVRAYIAFGAGEGSHLNAKAANTFAVTPQTIGSWIP